MKTLQLFLSLLAMASFPLLVNGYVYLGEGICKYYSSDHTYSITPVFTGSALDVCGGACDQVGCPFFTIYNNVLCYVFANSTKYTTCELYIISEYVDTKSYARETGNFQAAGPSPTLPPSVVAFQEDAAGVTTVLLPIIAIFLCCCLCCCHQEDKNHAEEVAPGTLIVDAFKSPQTMINGVAATMGQQSKRHLTRFASSRVPQAAAVPEAIPVFDANENRPYIDVVGGEKAVLQAIIRSDVDALKASLARLPKPAGEVTFWRGMTLMHLAVLAKDSPKLMILTLMQDYNMSVDVKNENGTTPLMLAAMMDKVDVVKFLVQECRAELDARDLRGLNVYQRNDCKPETMAELKVLGANPILNPLTLAGASARRLLGARAHGNLFANRTKSTLPRPGCSKGCAQSPQRSGILMTVLLYGWAILMFGCYGPTNGQPDLLLVASQMGGYADFCWAVGPDPWNYWGYIILGVVYALYLLEGLFWNRTVTYLNLIRQSEWTFSKLAMEAAEKPVLKMKLVCYHYESRGSGKDRHTEKVVTHTAEQAWEYDEYFDTQSELPYHDGLAKIKVFHKWGFGNVKTHDAFEQEKNEFIVLNARDVNQDFSTIFTYEKCNSHLSVDQMLGAKALSKRFYQFCTLLFSSLWYRIAINAATPKVEIVATKVITRRTDGPNDANRPLSVLGVVNGLLATHLSAAVAAQNSQNNNNNNIPVAQEADELEEDEEEEEEEDEEAEDDDEERQKRGRDAQALNLT